MSTLISSFIKADDLIMGDPLQQNGDLQQKIQQDLQQNIQQNIQEPDTKVRAPRKPRAKKKSSPGEGSGTNTKTIKAPGSTTERVAQACDRCRAKKVKCDGRQPCSSCAATGLKCIVSDKLSRRAFPKGYTETLEERIRQLESENKKLVGLLDIRDEQLELLNSSVGHIDEEQARNKRSQPITSSNLSLLNNENGSEVLHSHLHDKGCPCGCTTNPLAVHERPVSITGSIFDSKATDKVSIADSINLSDDDDEVSLLSFNDDLSIHTKDDNQRYPIKEVTPAPGAFTAATAIAQMQKNKSASQQELDETNKQQQLTRLVAVSIPRSTEETLFIPTLLARICQVHGYHSKPAILTANAIASLKENSNESMKPDASSHVMNEFLLKIILNRVGITKLEDSEASYFIRSIKLPTSRLDLDHLVTIYFQDWGNVFPILDKNSFLKNYMKLANILESSDAPLHSEGDSSYELVEKFGAIMVLVLSLSLLSNKYSEMSSKNPNSKTKDGILNRYIKSLNHYDYLIHEFIKPNCIITKHCSIQSLQILSLALQYCLVIGDIITCYELRGRVTTMAQQLRLHRCPAAVLGIAGNDDGNVNLRNFMQGERRILFWCIYCLDIYSSLNLGVPRLFKDFEIECALPFSGKNDDDDDDNENILIINNTKLSIVGKVSKFALSIMLYCKVLGHILDSIFSRFDTTNAQEKSLEKDRMLDCWRRELPSDLKFEVDVNGFSLKDHKTLGDSDDSMWKNYNKQQLTLIFLYYHAKILIYLPIISKYGNHHNVGLSTKEQLSKGQHDVSNIVSSVSMIQQSSIQILEVLKSLTKYSSSYLLPVPINIAREQARFTLLVAKGSLDYIKGGPLYQNLKQLLLDTISNLNLESGNDIPGGLTKNSVKLLELATLSILGLNLNKNTSNLKKRLSMSIPNAQPITKTAVDRGKQLQSTNGQYKAQRPRHSSISYSNSITNNLTSEFDNDEMFNTAIQVAPHRQSFDDRAMHSNNLNQNGYDSTFPPKQTSINQEDFNLVFNNNNNLNQFTNMSSSNSSSDSNNNGDNGDTPPDGLDNILQFDPFKVNLNRQLMMNEFAADGSLGLVPFLDMSHDENSEFNHDMTQSNGSHFEWP